MINRIVTWNSPINTQLRVATYGQPIIVAGMVMMWVDMGDLIYENRLAPETAFSLTADGDLIVDGLGAGNYSVEDGDLLFNASNFLNL